MGKKGFISTKEIEEALIAFRNAREWEKFHAPRQLASAISIEAAELLETFLWKTDVEVNEALGNKEFVDSIGDEIADVLSFTILLANSLGLDFGHLIKMKLEKNERRYPVSKSKGRANKYNNLD